MKIKPATHSVCHAGIKSPRFPLLVLLMLIGLGPQSADAVDRFYDPTQPGCLNLFGDVNCWLGGVEPAAGDNAIFYHGAISPYTVNFTLSRTNANATINNDNLIWDLGTYTYSLTADLTVGSLSGDVASLQIQNGTLAVAEAVLGQAATGDGTLLISTGAELTSSDRIVVGNFGTGGLQVINGGQLMQTQAARSSLIGAEVGAVGTAIISGTGSVWDSAGAVIVGSNGSGALTIEAGGMLNSGNGSIGSQAGSMGNVLITGAGSAWNNTASGNSALLVGSSGNGSLTIENGGSFSNDGTSIARVAGATGDVIVDGVGSIFTDTANIIVGEGGIGSMTIRNGASASANQVLVGEKLGGNGSLSIESGGQLTTSSVGIMGDEAGSTGTANVTGVGSLWDSTGSLAVGLAGDGTLNVFNGGNVTTAGGLRLGLSGTGTGDVTVDGAGSSIAITSDLEMGNGGSSMGNSLTISNGGSITSAIAEFDKQGAITITGLNSRLQISGDITNRGGGASLADANILISAGGLLSNQNSQFGGGSTVTVEGTGSQWNNLGSLIFDIGTLTVMNGGALTSSSATIGDTALGNGSITVTGTGSDWNNSGELFVGFNGTGTLNINSGGLVANTNGYLSAIVGSKGTATVSGTGSTWDNSSVLYVGYSDTGILNIDSGGLVTNTTGYMGLNTGSTGTVTVSGAGSSWTADQELYVGNSGTGTLDIDTGGLVTNTTGYLGNASGSTGIATVSGTGSTWDNSGDLYVGFVGTGTLNIDSGGLVSNQFGIVGNNGSGNGSVTVSGTGSLWDNSNTLYVGSSGIGTLNIDTGGMVTNTLGYLGLFAGSDGTATVSGTGSTWANSNIFVVGSTGVGTLNIDSSGLVTNTNGYLGLAGTGSGTATVGSGGTWSNGDSLYLGGDEILAGGTGVLNANTGGTVNVTNLLKLWGGGTVNLAGGAITAGSFDSSLGTFNFTDGTLTVNGSTGTYTDGNVDLVVDSTGVGDNPTLVLSNGASANYAAGYAYIGNSGTGTLNINSGSLVTNFVGRLGNNVGSNGTVTVSGVDAGTGTASTWASSNALYVGRNGTGTLNIDSGGLVTNNTQGYLGNGAGGSGTVTVSGVNAATGTVSTWTNTGALIVGNAGTGTLNIDSGGLVTNTSAFLGAGTGGSGTVTVSGVDAATGTASTWVNSADLNIGSTGTGILNINSGGQVSNTTGYLGANGGSNGTATVGSGGAWSNSDSLYVGHLAGGAGALNANTGGTVNVTNLLKVWNSGTVNLNGGTINTGMLDPLDGTFNFTAGTLNLTSSDLLVETGGILGSAISLSSFKSLGVSGTTTLNGASTLSLDGGTFSTGSLVNNGGFTFNKGTFNLTGDNLAIGAGGLFGSIAQFGINQTVNVTNTTTIDNGSVLSLVNGTFASGTTIINGTVDLDGVVSTLGGGAVTNNSLIVGDGRITAQLNNAASGEVRASLGDTLTFSGAGNTNSGRINLLGGTTEFTQDLTNASGGFISGRGTLITNGGLTNQGNIGLSSGTTDIYGDVSNATGGAIIVSGNGTATFYDDVVHNGTEIRVSSGSNAVLFGAVSGAGSYTGTGSLFFEGDLNPGNSPGLVDIGGDMSLGLNSRTIMEIAGLDRGAEYDAFTIDGTLSLGGELDVMLYDLGSGLFTPQLGDSFDLFTADIITGDFDLMTLAAIGGGLGWQMDVMADAIGITDVVRLSVVSSTVPLPPSVWLFGAGLLGLIGIARRRKAA